jgi:hypothetical protein
VVFSDAAAIVHALARIIELRRAFTHAASFNLPSLTRRPRPCSLPLFPALLFPALLFPALLFPALLFPARLFHPAIPQCSA